MLILSINIVLSYVDKLIVPLCTSDFWLFSFIHYIAHTQRFCTPRLYKESTWFIWYHECKLRNRRFTNGDKNQPFVFEGIGPSIIWSSQMYWFLWGRFFAQGIYILCFMLDTMGKVASGVWSSGMILASGVRGCEFNSRNTPQIKHFLLSNAIFSTREHYLSI